MDNRTNVIEYKCPCCGAGLRFEGESQQLTCEYCDTSFDIDAVRAYNENEETKNSEEIHASEDSHQEWDLNEQDNMHVFICPSCGGEIVTEATTAATFCPYCDNPTVLPGRLSGGIKPDAILPFTKTKEDAKAAFLNLCKGKPLLPKFFTQEQRLEKITGMYIPFWLYDCSSSFDGSYKATRIHTWSDSKYNYTKTDHFMLRRSAGASFEGIPMDGSKKMDDAFMESIEPFDCSQLKEFNAAYLSGYFADMYDVSSEAGHDRVWERVSNSINDQIQSSFLGYATVVPTSRQLQVDDLKSRYVLLPVWILNTKYKDKIYTFAMNGQTGKMTGSFPICKKRATVWFAGICAAATALTMLVQLIFS